MRRLTLVVLVVMLAGVTTLHAQDDGVGWALADAQNARELVEQVAVLRGVQLSPDGTQLAEVMGGEAICIYTIDTGDEDCTPWPEGLAALHYVAWSPGGDYLAFTEEFFSYAREPDLWMYDVEANSFANLTDDGMEGNFLDVSDEALIDYLPMWHPIDGDLYFFRSQRLGDYTLQLYRISPAGGEPELIRDMTNDLPNPFPVWRQAAISPDGNQIAMIVISPRQDDPRDGVWLLGLGGFLRPGGEMRQVLTLEDLRGNLPDWQEESYMVPYSLAWTADSMVVMGYDGQLSVRVIMNAAYVDAATGEVTLLADYSDIPDERDWFVPAEGEAHSGSYQMPRMGILSPDGEALIYLHYDSDSREMIDASALPLPPDGSEPVHLGSFEFAVGPTGIADQYIVAAAKNGRALIPIYHFLLTLEEK
jgi:hypothetical protein